MLEFSKRTNTLEQKSISIACRMCPNPTFTDCCTAITKYSKIPFNHRHADVPGRRALHHRHHLSRWPAGARALYRRADRAALRCTSSAGPRASSASASSFSTAKDRAALEQCRALNYEFPRSPVDTCPQGGFRLVRERHHGNRHPGELLGLPHLKS